MNSKCEPSNVSINDHVFFCDSRESVSTFLLGIHCFLVDGSSLSSLFFTEKQKNHVICMTLFFYDCRFYFFFGVRGIDYFLADEIVLLFFY